MSDPRPKTLNRQFFYAIAIFVGITFWMFMLIFVTSYFLNTARAFVHGESLWAKAQKNAIYHLSEYIYNQDPVEWEKYQQAINGVPYNAKVAREASLQTPPNYAVAEHAYLISGIHPADTHKMVFVIHYFHKYPYLKEALAIWIATDDPIARLEAFGERVHEAVLTGDQDSLSHDVLGEELHLINDELTEHELRFSESLGTTSRWLSDVILLFSAVALLSLLSLGLYISRRIVDRISTSVENEKAALKTAAEKERDANKAKSIFLATMSHEIRTPMNAILGMTDLMRDTKLEQLQIEYIDIIHSSGVALLDLINDILDYSKVESGRLELEHVNFDMEHTLNDIAYMLYPKAEDKSLELIVDYCPDCPRFINSDPGRVRQILINLIGNAIKFTKEGHIMVRVQKEGDRSMRFTVEDTGIGMTDEQMEHLFEVFVQGDSSTTRQYGGSGLGLAISKRLIDLFGGDIEVHSEIGKGSTFSFSVPVTEVEQPEPLHRSSLVGVRILVVDDYEPNRTVFKGQLEAFGMRVETAPDAASALVMLHQQVNINDPFEIVLTDQNMPEMDGLHFIEAMKNDPAISAALVAVSSSGHRGDGNAFKQAGATGYLIKPVDRFTLHEFLRNVLGNKGHNDPTFVTRHLIAEQSVKPQEKNLRKFYGRVLVAEDTMANVVVIRTLLKKLGLEVLVANNGQEAVEIYKTGRFDLLFMDLRMPVLDGFEATREIRRLERASGGHLPIVALTADVIPQTLTDTFEAGMDAYITKPFKQSEIIDTLAIYLLSVTKEEPAHVAPAAAVEQQSIDNEQVAMMRENLGDDFAEFLEAYLSGVEQMLLDMDRAIESGDMAALQRNAHSIKSSSQNAGAELLAEMGKTMESAARDGQVEDAAEKVNAMRDEFEIVKAQLTKE